MPVTGLADAAVTGLGDRNVSVLVVDDDEVILRLFEAYLPEAVTVASCVDEALCLLAQHPYDIVITDYYMPGTNGADLVREVSQRYPEIPVVVMTGFGRKFTLEDALDIGAAGYIAKPFRQRELVERLRTILELRGLRSRVDRNEQVLGRLRVILDEDPADAADTLRRARRVLDESVSEAG